MNDSRYLRPNRQGDGGAEAREMPPNPNRPRNTSLESILDSKSQFFRTLQLQGFRGRKSSFKFRTSF